MVLTHAVAWAEFTKYCLGCEEPTTLHVRPPYYWVSTQRCPVTFSLAFLGCHGQPMDRLLKVPQWLACSKSIWLTWLVFRLLGIVSSQLGVYGYSWPGSGWVCADSFHAVQACAVCVCVSMHWQSAFGTNAWAATNVCLLQCCTCCRPDRPCISNSGSLSAHSVGAELMTVEAQTAHACSMHSGTLQTGFIKLVS